MTTSRERLPAATALEECTGQRRQENTEAATAVAGNAALAVTARAERAVQAAVDQVAHLRNAVHAAADRAVAAGPRHSAVALVAAGAVLVLAVLMTRAWRRRVRR
ncbi:hypothetical protein ACFOWE_31030 [Planomonospora corallina]|uniref:DUF3618 domain-containing protein n=1 Tax=Planomonospora corallina TaxID=1806052 RepID=A0ABV8IFJ3_9ACTN